MGPGTEAGTQEVSHAISAGGVSQASTPSNRIAVYEDLRFAYDVHGNITERRIGWHTVQHLHYSAEHQLKSITVTRLHDRPALKAVGPQETTPPAATTQTTHYRYDALGRRIDKTGSFGTTRFGWDGDLLTLEIRGSKQSEYLYEPDSFVPLAKLESATHIQRPEHKAIHPKKVASLFKTAQTDSEQKEAPAHASHVQEAIESEASVEAVKEKVKDFSVYYYHCDQIGAPQELTDEQGHIVWAAEYKVWGRTEPLRISATGTDDPDPYDLNRFWPGGPRDLKARSSSTTQALNQVEQNLRFQGQYFDHESGLHYNRFRYYDAQTGRFVHQDPIGLFGGENLYFFGPNPLDWIDLFGLARCRKTSYPTWMKTRKGQQRHHLIPHELKDHSVFAMSGMNINAAHNMMYLPAQPDGSGKATHSNFKIGGCPHNDYNGKVADKLDKLADAAKKGKWDQYRIQRELLDLQSSLRSSLSKGIVP